MVGRVETRTLISRRSTIMVKRPSCGTRVMEMSIFAKILMRETMEAPTLFGGEGVLRSLPSMRKRIWMESFSGLMWMSLADSRTACVRMELTRRTTGASSGWPSSSLGVSLAMSRSSDAMG